MNKIIVILTFVRVISNPLTEVMTIIPTTRKEICWAQNFTCQYNISMKQKGNTKRYRCHSVQVHCRLDSSVLLNQTSLQSNSDVHWLDWNSLETNLVSVYIEIPTYTSKIGTS